MAYSADSTLYLYTSLTAGSSHVITATSRLETILKANKIPFRALDVATDEKARMLWGRRSKGRKLPGLVKYGTIIGDLEQIEEWNEYGELKQQIAATSDFGPPAQPSAETTTAPAPDARRASQTPDLPARSLAGSRQISISEPSDRSANPTPPPLKDESPLTLAMRQSGAEAAAKAGQKKSANPIPPTTDTAPSLPAGKLSKSDIDPDSAEVTATKTPEQLAAEGAKRTSVDKVAEANTQVESETKAQTETQPIWQPQWQKEIDAEAQRNAGASVEEHQWPRQRSSSMTKRRSRLSAQMSAGDMPPAISTGSSMSPISPVRSTFTPGTPTDPQPRTHRGSSISLASPEEIAEIERRNTIFEEDEEAIAEEIPVSKQSDVKSQESKEAS